MNGQHHARVTHLNLWIRGLIGAALLGAMLAAAAPAFAACPVPEDTSGNDAIVCTDSSTGSVWAGYGNDSITVQSGAEVDGSIKGQDGDDTIVLESGGRVLGDVDGGDDDDTIVVNGTAGDDEWDDVDGGEGDDHITVNGTVLGDVIGDDEDDTIVVNGVVNGDVHAGDDDDVVILQNGAVVAGTIKGGYGDDILSFAFSDCSTQVIASITAALAGKDPFDDSVTFAFNGQTYTWRYFQAIDTSALAALFCNPADPFLDRYAGMVHGMHPRGSVLQIWSGINNPDEILVGQLDLADAAVQAALRGLTAGDPGSYYQTSLPNANGWVVRVHKLGSYHLLPATHDYYQVSVYDAGGNLVGAAYDDFGFSLTKP